MCIMYKFISDTIILIKIIYLNSQIFNLLKTLTESSESIIIINTSSMIKIFQEVQ